MRNMIVTSGYLNYAYGNLVSQSTKQWVQSRKNNIKIWTKLCHLIVNPEIVWLHILEYLVANFLKSYRSRDLFLQ